MFKTIIFTRIRYSIAYKNLNFLNKILNSKIKEVGNPSSLIIIILNRRSR